MKIIYATILFRKQAAWLETPSCDFKLILKKVTGYGAHCVSDRFRIISCPSEGGKRRRWAHVFNTE